MRIHYYFILFIIVIMKTKAVYDIFFILYISNISIFKVCIILYSMSSNYFSCWNSNSLSGLSVVKALHFWLSWHLFNNEVSMMQFLFIYNMVLYIQHCHIMQSPCMLLRRRAFMRFWHGMGHRFPEWYSSVLSLVFPGRSRRRSVISFCNKYM